jgi:hypothetical protein
MELEEQVTVEDGDEEADDNAPGWVDEVALLMPDEQCELHNNIRPIRLILVKVSLSYQI